MTIYGDCETRGCKRAVRISDLTQTGCDIACGDDNDPLANSETGDLSLWIGAIGPLPATARKRDQSRIIASFKEPLDPRILAHFLVD